MDCMPLDASKEVPHNKLEISKISFGAGVFSGRYNSLEENWPLEAVRRALELGINCFDTSPYYNNSELILGDALEKLKNEYPRSHYYLSTKCGRYGHTKSDFNYSPKRVEESVIESCRRLKTTYLDIVLAHDVEFVSVDEATKAIEKLFELKANGIIKHVGISGYPLEVLLHITEIQYAKSQPLDVILSYSHYTLQSTLFADYIGRFRALGVKTLINGSPLSMGLFRSSPPPKWHPASTELRKAAAECAELAKRHNLSIARLALQFAFQWKDVDSTMIGLSNKEEVEYAIDAWNEVKAREKGEKTIPVTEVDVLKEITRLLEPYYNISWPSP
ncbi:3240_t:CDS:2 [Paraglomus occultum]|uniref:3240_t:CDS:1 n=1 Tax=Paraglomus occultum TaxID=144539 RepID=A0A9N9FIB4_9GLOM|nr:3240_t:CDS:2 [Paraglomus occultum]